ncbi:hypothetical protein QBC47DRAFT_3762 [Echria macrotheca]|uniref:Uncharacterized protein n=1 Tax=Echria macrotheca TaxID=438768 RepID=A0AAJ0BLD3_9PEZI|nr:hypothetical protein QBC47DRAFT_3762 [Echria macrotheca]
MGIWGFLPSPTRPCSGDILSLCFARQLEQMSLRAVPKQCPGATSGISTRCRATMVFSACVIRNHILFFRVRFRGHGMRVQVPRCSVLRGRICPRPEHHESGLAIDILQLSGLVLTAMAWHHPRARPHARRPGSEKTPEASTGPGCRRGGGGVVDGTLPRTSSTAHRRQFVAYSPCSPVTPPGIPSTASGRAENAQQLKGWGAPSSRPSRGPAMLAVGAAAKSANHRGCRASAPGSKWPFAPQARRMLCCCWLPRSRPPRSNMSRIVTRRRRFPKHAAAADAERPPCSPVSLPILCLPWVPSFPCCWP